MVPDHLRGLTASYLKDNYHQLFCMQAGCTGLLSLKEEFSSWKPSPGPPPLQSAESWPSSNRFSAGSSHSAAAYDIS